MSKNEALKLLNLYQPRISKQQYKTIKGQIICGDVIGALKGLKKVLTR